MDKPHFGIAVTHIDFNDTEAEGRPRATDEEKQECVNRYASVSHTLLAMCEKADENGMPFIPTEILRHIMWSALSKQDSDFEEKLKLAIEGAANGDQSVFDVVNGEDNLPDNVVKFPGTGSIN